MAILFHCPWDNADDWLAALGRALPGEDIRIWPETGAASEIDFAIVWQLPAGALQPFPNLLGICSMGAGVEGLVSDPTLPAGVPVARLVDGLMADRMAEYAAGCVLYYHLRHDEYARQQQESCWQRRAHKDAGDRTVGVFGLGRLGRHVARRLQRLEFDVIGWSRTEKRLDGIDCYCGDAAFEPALARAEIAVILLPQTPATRDILDSRAFSAMPDTGCLINCSRGTLIVERDLLEALDAGQLAGATLDVVREEPLPAGHPFWQHPRIRITPHVSSISDPASGAAILAEQVRRARRGEALQDVVDLERGY